VVAVPIAKRQSKDDRQSEAGRFGGVGENAKRRSCAIAYMVSLHELCLCGEPPAEIIIGRRNAPSFGSSESTLNVAAPSNSHTPPFTQPHSPFQSCIFNLLTALAFARSVQFSN